MVIQVTGFITSPIAASYVRRYIERSAKKLLPLLRTVAPGGCSIRLINEAPRKRNTHKPLALMKYASMPAEATAGG